jgi:hypothetical protein
MNLFKRTMVLGAVLLAGCGTTRNVAVSSYHVTRDVAVGSYRVATAPVHYALRRHNEPTMVGTTDAIPSDVTQPGHPAASTEAASAPQPQRKAVATRSQKPPRKTPSVAYNETKQPEPKPSAPVQTSPASTAFPTAKAVPNKPGYVFSPFDSSGRYVDVSGYTPGTKVKDPWTDKIFIVP